MGGSLVPSNLQQNMKTFWSRPEGKAGKVVVVGLVGAAGLVTWYYVLPFAMTLVANTLYLALMGGVLIGAGMVVMNHRFRANVGLSFKLLMRAFTGLLITIDPIGILNERIVSMKKKRDEMNEQIGLVNGSIVSLKTTIAKNNRDIDQDLKEAEFAKQSYATSKDPLQMERLKAQMGLKTNAAQRLRNSNESYQELLSKLQNLYSLLSRWATNVDYFIADTEDQVKQAETQYKTVNTAYSAFRSAMAVFKGNVDEQDIYDTTMEHLVDDATTKMGQMEDFQRVTQNFMDNIDLKNGAMNADALKELDAYEQKLLGPASTSGVIQAIPTPETRQKVFGSSAGTDDEYFGK